MANVNKITLAENWLSDKKDAYNEYTWKPTFSSHINEPIGMATFKYCCQFYRDCFEIETVHFDAHLVTYYNNTTENLHQH